MRRRATAFVVLALGVGVGLAVGGCGGAKTSSGGQVTVTVTAAADTGEATDTAGSGELETAPSADETTTEEETTTTNKPTGDPYSVGQTAKDDGVLFTVRSLREVESIPVDQYSSDGPIRPANGAKLVEAVVVWKNNTNEGVDNFCGEQGSILLDERDRNFDPIDRQYEIKGNSICSDDVQPGFKQTVHLAFQMPNDSEIGGLALWNSASEDDYFGDTYVLFVP